MTSDDNDSRLINRVLPDKPTLDRLPLPTRRELDEWAREVVKSDDCFDGMLVMNSGPCRKLLAASERAIELEDFLREHGGALVALAAFEGDDVTLEALSALLATLSKAPADAE